MWTKHYSIEGKSYYYNASQGKSLWSPPLDAIVHEAINARPPTYIELAGGSSSYGKNNEILVGPKVQTDMLYQNQDYMLPVETSAPLPIPEYEYDSYQNNTYNDQQNDQNNPYQQEQHQQIQQQQQQEQHEYQQYSDQSYYKQDYQQNSSLQQQYQQQEHRQQQEYQPEYQQYQSENNYDSSQFTIDTDESITTATINTAVINSKQKQQNLKRFRVASINNENDDQNNNTAPLSYLEQKNKYQAQEGCRDEESGKWLVR